MHAVNLLPKQVVVPAGHSFKPLAVIGAALVPVIAIVLVVIGYSSASSTVAAEKTKFAALQAQVVALGGATAAQPKAPTAAATATAAQWNALIAERTARRTELNVGSRPRAALGLDPAERRADPARRRVAYSAHHPVPDHIRSRGGDQSQPLELQRPTSRLRAPGNRRNRLRSCSCGCGFCRSCPT